MATVPESKKQFNKIQTVLQVASENNLNVLLRGESGVGKTHLVMDAANNLGLKLKYFSASTLDPFADLVGIPVPKEDHVEYLRLQDINDAEFMFFDELNRSHKRVMNAVLEIIQFKSLNGDKLKNLRMVWAAVNPWEAEGYQTEELDIALQGRFHYNIDVPYNVSYDYFSEKYGEDIAKVAYEWWWGLDNKIRLAFQPRRLDYTIEAMVNGLSFEYTAPFDVAIPFESLYKAIEISLSSVKLKDIMKKPEHFIEVIKEANSKNPEYVDAIRVLLNIKNSPTQVVKLLPVIIELPGDYLSKIITRNNTYEDIRTQIYETKGKEELLEWDKKIQNKIS